MAMTVASHQLTVEATASPTSASAAEMARGQPLGNGTGRDRPQPLARVACVAVGIADVVERIDGAGGQGQGDKTEAGGNQNRRIEQAEREHDRGEDGEVLDPLVRA